MILVTVGASRQFDRLIESVDKLIAEGIIKEKVIMQINNGKYIPKNAKWFRFKKQDNLIKLAKKARFLIVHGGIGSVGLAISLRKKAIAVPRLKKFDEAINDHQFQIIKEFAKEKKIIPSYEVADLKEAIGKIKTFKPNFTKEENKLRGLILQFIAKMQK